MKQLMPVVILAGGLATRLRPITETIPKSLIDIDGEPFVSHQLRLLKKHRIQHVILCIGYLGESIRDYVGDGSRFGLQVTYVQDGPALLGTGGAIKKALPSLPEIFFILYGDSYLTCDFAAVQDAFFASHKLALMTIYQNQNEFDVSNIEYKNYQIVEYDKINRTTAMKHIDYGLGVMTGEAFKYAPSDDKFDLATLYKSLLSENQLGAYEISERFYEIGSHVGIDDLKRHLSSNMILSFNKE